MAVCMTPPLRAKTRRDNAKRRSADEQELQPAHRNLRLQAVYASQRQ